MTELLAIREKTKDFGAKANWRASSLLPDASNLNVFEDLFLQIITLSCFKFASAIVERNHFVLNNLLLESDIIRIT